MSASGSVAQQSSNIGLSMAYRNHLTPPPDTMTEITRGVRTIRTSPSSSPPASSSGSPPSPPRPIQNAPIRKMNGTSRKRTENNSSTGGTASSSSEEDYQHFRPAKKSSSSAPSSPKIRSCSSLEDVHPAPAAAAALVLPPTRTFSTSALPVIQSSDINATIIEVSANSNALLRRSVGGGVAGAAAANGQPRQSGLVTMSQNYLSGVLRQSDIGINVLCNMSPEDIARQPDNNRRAIDDAISKYRGGLYAKVTNRYGAKVHLYAQGQVGNDHTLNLETIQGLSNMKRVLENILKEDTLNVPHTGPRVYSIHGKPGTGKATLVRSFCKDRKWNLVIVNSSLTEANLLTTLAQFALLYQPCFVYFDHCEEWFCDTIVDRQISPAMGTQPPVIESHVVQRASFCYELSAFMRNSTQLNTGSARAWFAIGVNRHHRCISTDFRQFIGSNYAPEEDRGCQYTETQLFKIAENCWFTQLQARGFEMEVVLSKSITMFRHHFPVSFKRRFNYEGFTPEMLNGIINQIFKIPIQRINYERVQNLAATDPCLLPNEADIDFVLHRMIQSTTAGAVHYNSNINY